MYLHVYDSSSTLLSEGTGQTPLVVGPLNASTNEVSAPIKLTIKTDAAYTTFGNTTLSFAGTSAGKWSICATSNGTFSSSLTITSAIASTGLDFYVKAQATSDENPINDTTVDISINAVIAAV